TGTLASRSLLVQEATKEIVDAIAAGGPAEDATRRWLEEMAASGEVQEGITAFLERRAPKFPWTGPPRCGDRPLSDPDAPARLRSAGQGAGGALGEPAEAARRALPGV